MFFELDNGLYTRYGITPIEIRKERASEVWLLVERLGRYTEREKARHKEEMRRPAGDNWF